MKLDIVEGARHVLKAPLRRCPFVVQRTALENMLNAAFGQDIEEGELDFLERRTVTLEVSDLGWCWPITLDTGRLVLRHPGCRPDTRIRGASEALLAIAVGQRDPDTLFFQRRLVVEGDTELGLALKNFLDAAQPDSPTMRRFAGVARAARRVLNVLWPEGEARRA